MTKCDSKFCEKDATHTIKDKELGIQINVCDDHYYDLEKYENKK